LDALAVGITERKVNWILDADVSDFFSKLDHSWMERFLEHRIADQRVLRLIRKWLAAGVIEDGNWSETVEGSPQGTVRLRRFVDHWTVLGRGGSPRRGVDQVTMETVSVTSFQTWKRSVMVARYSAAESLWRGGRKCGEMPLNADKKRCAPPAEWNRRIDLSCCRVG
jgi:hypothetical protein